MGNRKVFKVIWLIITILGVGAMVFFTIMPLFY